MTSDVPPELGLSSTLGFLIRSAIPDLQSKDFLSLATNSGDSYLSLTNRSRQNSTRSLELSAGTTQIATWVMIPKKQSLLLR
jgi:hypothetical protein